MRSFKEYSVKDLTVVDYTPGMGKEISYNAQKRKRKDVEELSMPTPKTGLSKAATGSVDKDKLKKDLERLRKGVKEDVNEVSSNTLGNYMRKSAAAAAKPGASARTQDKRIGGQKMADNKIRKKMGYSSPAKVPAGTNEAAPKVDPDKFAAHMAKSKKPEKKTSTQNSLSDISKRANEAHHDSEGIKAMKKAGNAKADAERKERQEGKARDRLLKMMNKASGRNDADRQKDAAAATARRKEADKDLAKFRSSMKTEEEDGVAQSYLDQDSEKKRKPKKDKETAIANPKLDNKKDAVAEEQDQTDEALTMQQRRAKSRQMKRLKGRIKLGRERQKRKMADPERLKKRARKAARNEILKKLTKGVPKGELTYSRRQELEKRLDKPAIKGRIDRLAKKMLPATRRKELDRRRGGASNKK